MREISPKNDLGPDYAIKVCLASAVGTTTIIMGVVTIWTWGLEMWQSLTLIGIYLFIYLLTGVIFFFSNPQGNSNPVWQKNGPW
jgi:hypothetical protein